MPISYLAKHPNFRSPCGDSFNHLKRYEMLLLAEPRGVPLACFSLRARVENRAPPPWTSLVPRLTRLYVFIPPCFSQWKLGLEDSENVFVVVVVV